MKTVLLLMAAMMLGGCSTSQLTSKVDSNPLPAIEKAAEGEYRIYRLDDSTIELVDTWPVHSVFVLGYSAFHAKLHYDEPAGELRSVFFLKSYQAPIWMFPCYFDLKDSFMAGALKPTMQTQARDILRWGNVEYQRRELRHGRSPKYSMAEE